MNAGIPITVGDIDVTVGARGHLGRVVEWTGGSGNKSSRGVLAGVRVETALTQNLDGPAFERKTDGNRVVPIGDIHDVVRNGHAVGRVYVAVAPRVQEVAVLVEHHHRRILALENVNSVLRVGRDGGDDSERLAIW